MTSFWEQMSLDEGKRQRREHYHPGTMRPCQCDQLNGWATGWPDSDSWVGPRPIDHLPDNSCHPECEPQCPSN